jgi:hypothetical protein
MQANHQACHQLLVLGQDQRLVGAHDDDEVVAAGQVGLVKTEGLAEETLDAVAADRGADSPAEDDAQARVRQVVGKSVGDERAAESANAGVEDAGEFGPGAKTAGLGE